MYDLMALIATIVPTSLVFLTMLGNHIANNMSVLNNREKDISSQYNDINRAIKHSGLNILQQKELKEKSLDDSICYQAEQEISKQNMNIAHLKLDLKMMGLEKEVSWLKIQRIKIKCQKLIFVICTVICILPLAISPVIINNNQFHESARLIILTSFVLGLLLMAGAVTCSVNLKMKIEHSHYDDIDLKSFLAKGDYNGQE